MLLVFMFVTELTGQTAFALLQHRAQTTHFALQLFDSKLFGIGRHNRCKKKNRQTTIKDENADQLERENNR
jgi:hypothetical protein